MTLDFTLAKYKELCNIISRYRFITVEEYLKSHPVDGFIILRHDVDRKPKNALKMAELEYNLGISATYYFRYSSGVFDKDIIRSISVMGHEIGYHYETLCKTNGDQFEAINVFKKELEEFRKICYVNTISMHGRPLSRYVSSSIWENVKFEDFNLLGDGSLSISDIDYYTDAGRSWDNKNNLRDYIKTDINSIKIRNTNDLIKVISTKSFSKLYLNIHPERWATNYSEFVISWCLDNLFNSGKLAIRIFRGG